MQVIITKNVPGYSMEGYLGEAFPVVEQTNTHTRINLGSDDDPFLWWLPNYACKVYRSDKLHAKITSKGEAEQFGAAFGLSADFHGKPLGYKYKLLNDTHFLRASKLYTRYS